MKELEFNSYDEAYSFLAKTNKASDLIYSIPYEHPNVVIERTREEYSPKHQKRDRSGEKDYKVHWADIPEYISPITGKPVDGRVARREDMKRSGSREADPSEFKAEYTNERFAKKYNLPFNNEKG